MKKNFLRRFIVMSFYSLVIQLLFASTLLASTASMGQNIGNLELKLDNRACSLKEFFDQVEKESDYHFFYVEGEINEKSLVEISNASQNFKAMLQDVANQKLLQFRVINDIIVVKKSEQSSSAVVIQEVKEITGKVVDSKGSPLPGVTVRVKGTIIGRTTDIEGYYSIIDIPEDAQTLMFSFVGMKSKEVNIEGKTIINVELEEEILGVDEVVVTALNITKAEKSLGYAFQKVDGENVAQSTTTNMVNTLSGRAAGVQIVANGQGPGKSTSIVIRGYSSMAGNNQPLFVVDGIPINNNTDFRTSTLSKSKNVFMDFGNGAGEINPDDIESISVLKGANAAALYGSRAANGAIIITTKSGKGKKSGISFSSKTTFETMLKGPEYQRVYGQGKNFDFQFVDGYGGGTYDGVDESWGPKMDGTPRTQFDSPTSNGLRGGDIHTLDHVLGSSGIDLCRRGDIIPTPFVDPGDPLRSFMQTGRTLVNSLSFYGSDERGSYRIGYTNLYNEGIVPNTDIKRNTVSFSGDYKITDRLKVSSKINYVRTDSDNRHVNAYSTESIMYAFIWWGQSTDIKSLRNYWQDGLKGYQQFNYNYNYHDNPYFTVYENTNGMAKDRIIGNFSATYDITNDLNIMVRGARDFFSEYRFIKRAYSTQRFPNGQYREDKINFQETNFDFLLSYNKTLAEEWHLNANFGGNRMVQKDHFNSLAANKLLIPEVYSFSNVDGDLVQIISRPMKQINSLYGFAQIGWNNSIFLDLTARNDWSSTLPEQNNSYFYPSASLSVILSDLLELKQDNTLSYAKFRGGWAQVGSDTDAYRLSDYYVFGTSVLGNQRASLSDALPNFNLKPEIQTSYEFGADLRFLKSRLNIDATYYHTISNNQILDINLPVTSGRTARTINAGRIRNQGIELMVSTFPVKNNNFIWNSTFNFSLNRNKVMELSEGVDRYSYGNHAIDFVAVKGGSLGDMWGTDLVRVEDKDSPYYGEVIFKDGLVQQDNTLKKLGNFNPDFTLGWNNTVSYKNFSLNFLFDWRQGGELISRTRLVGANTGNVVESLWGRSPEFGGPHPGILDSGLSYTDASGNAHTDGIIGDGVKQLPNGSYVQNDVIVPANAYHNNRYKRDNETQGIYDATFIKLREVKLSYDFPKKFINKLNMQSLSLSLIGTNLWLWAKEFNHGDPELLSFDHNNGSFLPGVEDATVPSTRSFGFAINLKF